MSILLASDAMLLTPEPGRPLQQAARVVPALQQTPAASPAKTAFLKPGTGTSNTPGHTPAKALEAANIQAAKPSDFVDDSEWSSLCSLAAGIEAECSGNASGEASISGGWSDDGETLEATAEAYAQAPGTGAESPGQRAAGLPFDSNQGSPAALPRRPASRASHAAARAVRAVSHLLARSTRLQARGLKSTAALALQNNALLRDIDTRISTSSAESQRVLQDAAQMADWAKQVVNLSRELGVYKNQCAHHYEAWIRATQLLQEKESELALAHNELAFERDQTQHSQRASKALLDQLQSELLKATEEMRARQTECKELRATLQAIEKEYGPVQQLLHSSASSASVAPGTPGASTPHLLHTRPSKDLDLIEGLGMGGLGLNGLLAAGAGQDSMAAEQGAQSTAGSHGDGSGATGATSQAARLQDPERMRRKFHTVLKHVAEKSHAQMRERDHRIKQLEERCIQLERSQGQQAQPASAEATAATTSSSQQADLPSTSSSTHQQALEQAVQQLKEQLQVAQEQLSQAQRAEAAERAKAEAAHQELGQVQEQVQALEQQVQALQEERRTAAAGAGGPGGGELSAQLRSAQSELDREREMHESVLQELQQATSRLRDSEAKAARIQRELTSLKELQATSALDLSAAHSRAQQAEQELGEAQARVEHLQQEVESAQEAVAAAQKAAAQAQAELAKARAVSPRTVDASPLLSPARQPSSAAGAISNGGDVSATASGASPRAGADSHQQREELMLAQSRVSALESELSAVQHQLTTLLEAAKEAATTDLQQLQEGDSTDATAGGADQDASTSSSKSVKQGALLALLGMVKDAELRHGSVLATRAGAVHGGTPPAGGSNSPSSQQPPELARIRTLQGQLEQLLTTALDANAAPGALRDTVQGVAQSLGLPLTVESGAVLKEHAHSSHAAQRVSSNGQHHWQDAPVPLQGADAAHSLSLQQQQHASDLLDFQVGSPAPTAPRPASGSMGGEGRSSTFGGAPSGAFNGWGDLGDDLLGGADWDLPATSLGPPPDFS